MELSLGPPVRPALRHVIVFAAVLLQTACQSSTPQPDSPAASIRFYTVNNQNQQRELYLLPNRSRTGCFNLPVSVDIYRVAQIGFEYCSIYSENLGVIWQAHTGCTGQAKPAKTPTRKTRPPS
ncbi:MAG: hypothetical protein Ct9H300mP16_11570 [Pseudomonadota bacterium]|nr:MAG: hypothetical protein Ct9H300mP16_11570 [Pseudomonadota bacterium]